ncbi:F-box/LRR-repeat protein At3g26922-like [Rutidosis leptorrhynchoides]|uniref:F-box/LRR-repeat protein At3g26922-like n=1 Tax=Rutidosis leptorrhynchoides TaxID=125765 RepID=UPI003A98EB63
MNSRRYRKRLSVERDRLSSLPNDLIHKIFSYIGIKDVVRTSILSSKWRFIWTSTPYLNFSSNEFSSLLKFSESVTLVLSRRNNQIEVESVNLSLNGRVSQAFVKRTLDYAFNHNVQHMTIACLPEMKIRFPISLFTSHLVKHLTIIGSTIDRLTPTSTWELPALTTLHIENVTLYDEDDYYDNVDCDLLFSNCLNLKTLTLNNCNIMGSHGFNICHLQLTKLTLMNGNWGWELVNVVAPKLENLTIVNCDSVHLNSVPELTSLIYGSRYSFQVSADGLPSLENVDVSIAKPCETDVYELVRLLQQLQSVKFLTLNLEIIELLSSSAEVISDQPSPFVNKFEKFSRKLGLGGSIAKQ